MSQGLNNVLIFTVTNQLCFPATCQTGRATLTLTGHHLHWLCLYGGCDCRTAMRMRKRKSGHSSSIISCTCKRKMKTSLCFTTSDCTVFDRVCKCAEAGLEILHLVPPAVCEVFPQQQVELCSNGHDGWHKTTQPWQQRKPTTKKKHSTLPPCKYSGIYYCSLQAKSHSTQ